MSQEVPPSDFGSCVLGEPIVIWRLICFSCIPATHHPRARQTAAPGMRRSHKLLQAAAHSGCTPAACAPSAPPHGVPVASAPYLNWLRSITSLSQFPLANRQHQDCCKHLQRPLPPSLLPQQQHRQLFGIGEASDTNKDYKERRLIGYEKLLVPASLVLPTKDLSICLKI